jgi:parallel beta-helix repeat protein
MTISFTQKAATQLTIYLAPGTYSGLSLSNLNFANGIVIASADPNNPAVIAASAVGFGNGLNVTNSSGITFSHLDFQSSLTPVGSPSVPFLVNNSSNITFDHVNIHGTLDGDPTDDGTYGLDILNSNHITVSNSTIQQEVFGIGVSQSSNITISNNTIHDIECDGLHMTAVSNLTVSNNSFTNFHILPGDHPDAIQIFTAGTTTSDHDITITGNTISVGAGDQMQGIFLRDEVGTLPYQNVTITNNVLTGTLGNGILVADGQNVTVSGNTITQGLASVSWIVMDTVNGLVLTNNNVPVPLQLANDTNVTNSGNTNNTAVASTTPAAPASFGPSVTPTPVNSSSVINLTSLQSAITSAGYSTTADYSPDGTQLVFSSNESLISGDANGATDIYLETLATGVLARVSTTSAGAEANGASQVIGFSADGHSLFFLSKATNLTGGTDANGATPDLYKKDLLTGTVTQVLTGGVTANRFTAGVALSANGAAMVFSAADISLNGDATNQVYLINASTGVVTEISHPGSGGVITLGVSTAPVISADGTKVAFVSTTKFDAGDTNGKADVFIYDVASHAITRVTNYAGAGTLTANAFSPSGDKLYYTDATTPGAASVNPNDVLHVVSLSGLADQIVGGGLSGATVSANGQFIATSRDVQLANGNWTHQAELLRVSDGAVQDLHAAGLQNSIGTASVLAFAPTGGDFAFADGSAGEISLVSGLSTVHSDYGQAGLDALLFRNPTSGDWGFMVADPGGGQSWHPIGGSSSDYVAIGRGDFNGDGVLDAAFRQTSTGNWGFLTANPTGGQTWHAAGNASLNYDPVANGDILHDGATDIVFRNAANGDWGFMSTNGAGSQAWHPIGATGAAYNVVGSGDFNGDGIFDVAFRDGATGDWGYMSVSPTGGETWHGVGNTSSAYTAVASADFLGTGQTEIAFRNASTGDWGFMQANVSGGQTWHHIGSTGTGYSVIGNGDYNGDGVQDVAFRNVATGDWGYMTVNPAGGEIWHGVGNASLAYGTI